MTPDERYAALAATYADDPDVTLPGPGSGFGASALKAGGRIFAMAMADQLVVKLPRPRVEELIASGEGAPFESGGRVLREWATVTSPDRWADLAAEARAFADSRPARRGRSGPSRAPGG